VMWWRVFSANMNFDIWELSFRPAHWVLIVGLAVTLASFLWSLRPKPDSAGSRPRSGGLQPVRRTAAP